MTSSRLTATPVRSTSIRRAGTIPLAVPDAFDARRVARRPQPLNRVPTVIDAETVIARLEEAGHTLLCLPRTGPTTALRQTRHQYVAEALEAYAATDESRPRPPVPPANRITRMDQALSWIQLVPADKLALRRIVGCRCLVSPLTGRHLFSWRRLARLLGADHKAVQRWHAIGIDTIVAVLNRDNALASAWDRLG